MRGNCLRMLEKLRECVIFNENHCDNRIQYSFAISDFATVFSFMLNAPLIILLLYKDLFFMLLLLERRSEGSKVEAMCDNMRAKLQCYLEAIVCVVDVPVRNLRRPAFLLILLTG